MSRYIAQRYRLFAASETAYGVFNADPADHGEIRPDTEGFSQVGKTERLERDYIRADLGNSPGLPGAKSCEVKLSLPARGGGYAAGPDIEARLNPELASLLATCCAARHADTGAAVTGGGLDSVILDGVPSECFTPGGLVFVDPLGSGNFEARWIAALDDTSHAVTLAGPWKGGAAWNLSTAPAATGQLYAAVQAMPGATGQQSACLEVSGIAIGESAPVWRYTGMYGTAKIDDAQAGKRLMIAFALQGDSYEIAAGTPVISHSAGAGSWPVKPADLKTLNAEFRLNGQRLAYQSLSLDLGNQWEAIPDGNAANGRAGFALTRIATGGKAVVYWDPAYTETLSGGERVDFSWVVGGPADGVGFHAPVCELTAVKETTINGLLAMELAFVVLPSGLPGIPDWTWAFAGTPVEAPES